MAGFSGALRLTDLDDFITPSQVRPTQAWERSKLLRLSCELVVTSHAPFRCAGVHQTGEGRETLREGRVHDKD